MTDHQLDPEMLVFTVGPLPFPPPQLSGGWWSLSRLHLRRARTGRGLDRDHQPPKNTFLGKGEWELLEFPLPVCSSFRLPLVGSEAGRSYRILPNLYLTQTGLLIEGAGGPRSLFASHRRRRHPGG